MSLLRAQVGYNCNPGSMALGDKSSGGWASMPIKAIEIESIMDCPYLFRRDLISFDQLVLDRLGIGDHACGQAITPQFSPPLSRAFHISFVTSTSRITGTPQRRASGI